MKRTLPALVILILTLTLLFASCGKNSDYATKLDMDASIIELEQALKSIETKLNASISNIDAKFVQEITLLEADIAENEKLIDDLKKADGGLGDRIDEFKAKNEELKAKIAELKERLDTLYNDYVKIEEHTVRFDSNGGSDVPDQKVKTLGNATMPTIPDREHYHIEGWYLGDERWSFAKDIVVRDITLTAKWEPTKYKIIYDFNDGSTPSVKTYTHFDKDGFTLPTPGARNGYDFLGWSIDGGEPQIEVTIQAGSFGDKSYVAIWKARPYKINFIANGGKEFNTTDLIYGEVLETPKRDSDIFLGWYELDDFTTKVTTVPAKDTTLYALWSNESLPTEFIYEEYLNAIKITGIGQTSSKKLSIPKYINNKPVTEISENAFSESDVERIMIPSTVTVIRSSAFENAKELKTVVLTKGLVWICENAFNGCDAIANVYYASDNESFLEIQIDDGNDALTGVEIKYNTTMNGDNVISGEDILFPPHGWG